MESNFLINRFCAILRLDMKKRSLARCQNSICEERHEVARISAAAKFRISAHRADFGKPSGLQSLTGHCSQSPVASAYAEIVSHLNCLRQERAGLRGSGELQHFGNVRRCEWKRRHRRGDQWSLTNHLVDPPRAVDLPVGRHVEGTGGK